MNNDWEERAPHPEGVRAQSGTSVAAIVSVTLGMISVPMVICCSCLGLPVPVMGLLAGIYGVYEARQMGSDKMLSVVGVGLNGLVLLGGLAIGAWAFVMHDRNIDAMMKVPDIASEEADGGSSTDEGDGSGGESSWEKKDDPS